MSLSKLSIKSLVNILTHENLEELLEETKKSIFVYVMCDDPSGMYFNDAIYFSNVIYARNYEEFWELLVEKDEAVELLKTLSKLYDNKDITGFEHYNRNTEEVIKEKIKNDQEFRKKVIEDLHELDGEYIFVKRIWE